MLGDKYNCFLCVHKWIICHETKNDLYDIALQFMDVCPRSGADFGGNLHIVARLYTVQDQPPGLGRCCCCCIINADNGLCRYAVCVVQSDVFVAGGLLLI